MSFELGTGRAAVVLRSTTALFFAIHLSLSWSEEAYEEESVSTCHRYLGCCLVDLWRPGSNTRKRIRGACVEHG
jgi:hypothetical protein